LDVAERQRISAISAIFCSGIGLVQLIEIKPRLNFCNFCAPFDARRGSQWEQAIRTSARRQSAAKFLLRGLPEKYMSARSHAWRAKGTPC
jgi:hypothetical protein